MARPPRRPRYGWKALSKGFPSVYGFGGLRWAVSFEFGTEVRARGWTDLLASCFAVFGTYPLRYSINTPWSDFAYFLEARSDFAKNTPTCKFSSRSIILYSCWGISQIPWSSGAGVMLTTVRLLLVILACCPSTAIAFMYRPATGLTWDPSCMTVRTSKVKYKLLRARSYFLYEKND